MPVWARPDCLSGCQPIPLTGFDHLPLPESILTRPSRPLLLWVFSGIAAFLASCAAPYRSTPQPAPGAPTSLPAPSMPAPSAPGSAEVPPAVIIPLVSQLPSVSHAPNALAYRRDAATHLYAHNAQRIYKGMLRPNLYAVGVLEVDIDRQGQVIHVNWRRAPRHAPEVMSEIVRTVRAAAPYPVPARMGRVTYTDVWLWDKSGQFQLDTLTEGQL